MKKKILLFILLLVPFMVQAKEGFSYKWDIIPTDDTYLFVEEQPEGYTFVKGNALLPGRDESTPQITIYDAKKGTVAKTYTIDAYGEKYRDKESNENVSYALGESSGRFMLYISSEEKMAHINAQAGTLELCASGDTDCTEHNIYELSDADLKKYTGKYYFIFKKHKENPSIPQYGSYSHGLYTIVSLGGTSAEDASITYDFYLEDGTKVSTVTVLYKDIYKENYTATIASNGIYIIKTERDFENKKISYKVTKYDRSGNKVYTEDVTPLVRQTNHVSASNLIAYDVEDADTVESGVLLKLKYNQTASELGACIASYDPTDKAQPADGKKINPSYLREATGSKYDNCLAEVLDDDSPQLPELSIAPKAYKGIKFLADGDELPEVLVVKLGLEYEITTKVKGNGTIRVVSSASGGDGVTFIVEPQKGYVLGEIKVTDEFGNVLKFTDYTFTMPNANVLIEATFIVNPDTGAFVPGLIVMGALLIACIILFVSEKNQKIKTIS